MTNSAFHQRKFYNRLTFHQDWLFSTAQFFRQSATYDVRKFLERKLGYSPHALEFIFNFLRKR